MDSNSTPKRRRINNPEYSHQGKLHAAEQSVTVPLDVIILMPSAFFQYRNIIEIDLPETLRTIRKNAFYRCISLTGISIPPFVEDIDDGAFQHCTSLMGVELPDTTRSLNLEKEIFKGCKALVNISFPPNIFITGYDVCKRCDSLFKFPEPARDDYGDLKSFLYERFKNLPVHKACYHARSTTVDHLLAAIGSDRGYPNYPIDVYEMGPMHVVASSAILRIDLMETLIDKYEMRRLHDKDGHGKTAMDYLLANRASKSAEMIKMVLKRTFKPFGWTGWGLEKWQSVLCAEIESKSWDGNFDSRRECLRELAKKVSTYGKVEMSSLLELALWKVEMNQGDSDRDSSRMTCGSNVVIGNVFGYISDDSTTATASSTINFMGWYLEWLEGVFQESDSSSDESESSLSVDDDASSSSEEEVFTAFEDSVEEVASSSSADEYDY
ncbi:unnamed protein product [Cylindrotheca closterium]|uniref:Uncharacterized protein n=1 Tax=Cylindrotheca closterium TaxID=2856 RepID=A0AAD2FSY7_9STRA|nr:unnamed protein product [Cylindrotheca closterium]